MERTSICICLQKISIPQMAPKCWFILVVNDTIQWHGIGSILSWWKAEVNPASLVSHTLFRCVLMRQPLFAQLVLAPREPDAAVTYWATISTFISRPHAQVESSPGDTVMRLQWVPPSVKNFRVQGWKRLDWWERWLLVMGIKMDGVVRIVWERTGERWDFFLWNHFKIAQLIFYFEMKCWVSSLMVSLWVGVGLPEAYWKVGVK